MNFVAGSEYIQLRLFIFRRWDAREFWWLLTSKHPSVRSISVTSNRCPGDPLAAVDPMMNCNIHHGDFVPFTFWPSPTCRRGTSRGPDLMFLVEWEGRRVEAELVMGKDMHEMYLQDVRKYNHRHFEMPSILILYLV
jgi:hypothetical protein